MNVLLLYSCSDSLTRHADPCPNIVAWTSYVLSPIASLRIRPPQDVDVPADLDDHIQELCSPSLLTNHKDRGLKLRRSRRI